MPRTTTASTTSLGRGVLVGAGAGILASLVMVLYAMIAGWAKGAGFFTRSTTSPHSGPPRTR
jgi:hypothetical protein